MTWKFWFGISTGDVDPVLARVLHLIRYRWPAHVVSGLELDSAASGTLVDEATCRLRSLSLVDGVIRRALPVLLRSVDLRGAASSLESLPAIVDAHSAGVALERLFDFEQGVRDGAIRNADGAIRNAVHAAWYAARHLETGLCADRTHQIAGAAVNAFDALFDALSPPIVAQHGGRDPAIDLAAGLFREAALLTRDGAGSSIQLAVISSASARVSGLIAEDAASRGLDSCAMDLLLEMSWAPRRELDRVAARYYSMTGASLWAPYRSRCPRTRDAGFVLGDQRCVRDAHPADEEHVF